jgi:hypothetical protein
MAQQLALTRDPAPLVHIAVVHRVGPVLLAESHYEQHVSVVTTAIVMLFAQHVCASSLLLLSCLSLTVCYKVLHMARQFERMLCRLRIVLLHNAGRTLSEQSSLKQQY